MAFKSLVVFDDVGVRVFGPIHGAAFVAYLVMAVLAWRVLRWSSGTLVVAEGDYVIVVFPREYDDPRNPGKKYTTTWFDMWRFKDGKADEHWDPATLPPAPPKA